MPDTALEIRGVAKSFEGEPALSDLNLQALPGETVALLGPNGAGKTTALRCVAGILEPDGGSISIYGHRAGSNVAQGLLSLLPEEPELYPGLTVMEHLRFIALAYKVTDWRERVDLLLKRFALAGREDSLPGTLSHGMRRKLSLAMALLHDARVVLLDEPFNGLDPRATHELKNSIKDLAAEGATVIVATHLLPIAQEIANQVVVIHHGRDIAAGSIKQLRDLVSASEDANLEEVFLVLTAEADV